MCGDLPPEAARFGIYAGAVYRLLHAVYGLKDAPRLFCAWLRKLLVADGWTEIDDCIYVRAARLRGLLPAIARVDDRTITDVDGIEPTSMLQTYVDDLVSGGERPGDVVSNLRRSGVDVDDAEFLTELPRTVVGRQLAMRKGHWVTESQQHYLESIVLLNGKRGDSVVVADFQDEADPSAISPDLMPEYRQLLGALGWSVRTRWDLAFAFSALAQFTTTPTPRKLRTLRSVLRLARDHPRSLRFVPVARPELRLYVDAAWHEQNCRSRSGYLFQLADTAWAKCYDNVLSWGTHQEKRYVRSAPGAELLALVKGLLHAPALLRTTRLIFGRSVRLLVRTDSATMLDQLRARKVFKEISLLGRLHWALQELEAMDAVIEYVATTAQLADPLTKWIPPVKAWPLPSSTLGSANATAASTEGGSKVD
eukprot:GDKH01002781.1.p1 GENE.GDKH01002781.1~~GDKH01002781.1.p1  ORF type:complete len:423 (-),score=74.64 GDKH01002781.1:240-1508(-)